MNDIELLEQKYTQLKMALGNKLAEYRQIAGYPKRTYDGGSKSANILFNVEGGKHLPNEDTIFYFVDLFDLNEKQKHVLLELQREGKKIKKEIIRAKRGWY